MPGQRANGGTHAAFISCEIQWHQILNISLWSTACLVPPKSHLNPQQPGENKEKGEYAMTAVITGNLLYKIGLSREIEMCVFAYVFALHVCPCARANLSACTHQRVSLQQA